MDEAKINCFTTPTANEFEVIFEKVQYHLSRGGPENRIPHANQLWMSVGFRLFSELKKIAPCIEVFPQATARVVGSGQIHKSQAGGVDAQLATIAKHTGWPGSREGETDFYDIAFAPAHDRLDAYLSAWVAALEEPDRVAFGTPPNDVIWTPRISGAKHRMPLITKSRKLKTSQEKKPRAVTAEMVRDCPACGQHQFKRWPFGWDAHAAHRCKGLSTEGFDARKSEFKSRFGHLF